MDKKAKIAIGIVLGIGAGIGIYFGIKKFLKKKEDEPTETDQKEVSQKVNEPSAKIPAVTVKRPVSRIQQFADKVTSSSAIKQEPKQAPKSGKKAWVYAKAEGTKVYKKSTTKGVNIGPLYNSYNKGKIIGNYVGSTSVGGEKWIFVNDGSTPLIVSDKLIYTKTI